MRVAALIATESVSGPGRQLAALAAPLRQRGVDLHVLVLSRNPRETPAYARHLERAEIDHSIIEDRGPIDTAIVGSVQERMRELDALVLQTHGYKATATGWVIRRSRRVPVWIGFFHGATDKGTRDRFYQAVERRMLHSADRIVVVASAQSALFGGRATVIPNAVVPAVGNSAEACVDLSAARRPLIGVIGRLSREKGVDIFLHACAEVRARSVAFSAVVVGAGPERDVLGTLAVELGLQDVVRFVGHSDAVEAIYRALDLVVLPSRSEGLPNVLLEALAADRPVVATAVGAVPEVLSIPGAGIMVPPNDSAALADGIIRALQPGRTNARARAETVSRYSLDARVQRHVELYEGLRLLPSAPQLSA